MNFSLSFLPLCLLLILAIFPNCDGQLAQNQPPVNRRAQYKGQGPNQFQQPNQMPNRRYNQQPNQMPNRRYNQQPNQQPNQPPNQMSNQQPNQMLNQRHNQRPYQKNNERQNQMFNQRLNQLPGERQSMNKVCQFRGQFFRAGAKIVSNCQLCTCFPNGQTQCAFLTCNDCYTYQALASNQCCLNKCRNNRKMPVGFEFEEGIFGEDRTIEEPHYQGSSDSP